MKKPSHIAMEPFNDEDHSVPKGSENGCPFSFKLPGSIFIVSVVATMLPKMLSKSRFVKRYFGYITVFTAGLQLSTILVDLIPHMASGHHHHHEHNISELYPHIASGLCFLLLLAIDSIFLHNDRHDHESTAERSNSQKASAPHNHDEEAGHSHHREGDQGCHDTVGTCNTSAISRSKTKTEGVLFLLAISIHSLFEGLAVTADLRHLPLLTGLLFHKMLESFAIGVSVFGSSFSLSVKILLLVIYSSLTPLAILIKDMEFFANSAAAKEWFTALCIGSLIFVVFFEMIGHSFHGGKNMVKKICIITGGYLIGCTSIALAHAPAQ